MGVPPLWHHQWRNAGRLSLHGCWCSRYLVPVRLIVSCTQHLSCYRWLYKELGQRSPKNALDKGTQGKPISWSFYAIWKWHINLTFFYLARRRLKFVQTVQARYSYLYWDWYRCRLIHLHTVAWLVSKLNQTEKIITDTCIGIWFG